MIFAALRSFFRISRGMRARPADLDRIILGLRNRQLQGKPLRFGILGQLFSSGTPERRIERSRRLQLKKLKRTVNYVYEFVPYYREKMDALNLKPADIRSLDDIRKLPITRRSILQEHRDQFISRNPEIMAVQEFKTTGTTGKSLVMYISADELHYYAAGEAIGGLISGMWGPASIFQVHLPLEGSAAAVLATNAAQMAGALVLNYGLSGSLEEHVKSLFMNRNIPGKNPKVTALFTSLAYLWALTRKAEDMRMDFSESDVKWIMTGGAMVSEELKKRVSDTWGVRLSEGYAMVEIPAVAAGECEQGRMHFLDLTGFTEVLDPVTLEPVSEGEQGILVTTEFYPDKELMPILRYWTQDLVIAGSNRICDCGNPASYIEDILGRADHMIIAGGQNYYPQEIGDSLVGIPGLVSPPRFSVSAKEDGSAQVVSVVVEYDDSLSNEEKNHLEKMVNEKIAFANLLHKALGAVKIRINLLPPDTIDEPFPYKHQGPELV